MTTHEGVAVVIPAAGCACRQVHSVLPQLTANDRVVLVRNGRPPAHNCTATVAHEPRATLLTFTTALTPAAARNAGVVAAHGAKVYAFVDADDRASQDWLRTLTGPLLDGTADVTGGALAVMTDRRTTTVHPGEDYWHEQALFGGNLALTAAAWEALGGFDAAVRYSEDTDLAWRAAHAGLRVRVVVSAVVQIEPRSPTREFVQRFCWGHSAPSLIRRHGLKPDHLPTFRQLLDHKRSIGYCGNATIAATAQWAGQWLGRLGQLAASGRTRPP